jgi:hypothetical protein
VRNNETSIIHAWSDGAGYVVEGTSGRMAAPAGLQPIAPWSINIVEASMLMSPESGKLYPAAIQDEGFETLNVGGTMRRVRHYVLRAGSTNHLYFDEAGVLLGTEYADITGTVTISVKKITEEP